MGIKKHNLIKLPDSFGVRGRIIIRTYRVGTKKLLRELIVPNLVVSSSDHGRNLIAQRLAGTNTYTLNITHGEIGTGTATPLNNDTALQTPTLRKAKTLESVSNNIVTIQFFMSDAELADGTYNEFGTFVDGSATIGTGQLFNRALFATPYIKASGEDTTVEVEFTIT
ncbi:MAG: hypothetical protein KJI72_00255 [Patescibacteria group bacterium]|nr:hypothetical protein [Patescibacteria group bacterium]